MIAVGHKTLYIYKRPRNVCIYNIYYCDVRFFFFFVCCRLDSAACVQNTKCRSIGRRRRRRRYRRRHCCLCRCYNIPSEVLFQTVSVLLCRRGPLLSYYYIIVALDAVKYNYKYCFAVKIPILT